MGEKINSNPSADIWPEADPVDCKDFQVTVNCTSKCIVKKEEQ
jgi:hypothetical protein